MLSCNIMIVVGVVVMRNYLKVAILLNSLVLLSLSSLGQSKCNPEYNTKTYNDDTNYYYGDCPCIGTKDDLRRALGDKVIPTACVSDYEFSLLTGGPLTLTSEDYGNAYSCFFQNVTTDDKKEVVEFADRDEIRRMHEACDRVIRQFARDYNLNCK